MRERKRSVPNPYPYSDTNKRYQTLDYYLKHRFGGKVAKIALDAGFTCPNLADGSGGCIFCLGGSSGSCEGTLTDQYRAGIEAVSAKWKPIGYIPYLQAHTNTFAPPERLRRIYEEAAGLPDAKMLAIATRADCLGDAVLSELQRISEKIPLLVELGMQTSSEKTLKEIRRGYSHKDFLEGYTRLRSIPDITVCLHMIVGLPGESREEIMATAEEIARLRPEMVKIHTMLVLKNTELETMMKRGAYEPLPRGEAISLVASVIERLPENTVIARVMGDNKLKDLAAPLWTRDKVAVLNELDQELLRRNSFQGAKRKETL